MANFILFYFFFGTLDFYFTVLKIKFPYANIEKGANDLKNKGKTLTQNSQQGMKLFSWDFLDYIPPIYSETDGNVYMYM